MADMKNRFESVAFTGAHVAEQITKISTVVAQQGKWWAEVTSEGFKGRILDDNVLATVLTKKISFSISKVKKRPSDRRASDRRASDRPTDERPTDERPTDERPSDRPTSDRPTDERPADLPKSDRPTSDRPILNSKNNVLFLPILPSFLCFYPYSNTLVFRYYRYICLQKLGSNVEFQIALLQLDQKCKQLL